MEQVIVNPIRGLEGTDGTKVFMLNPLEVGMYHPRYIDLLEMGLDGNPDISAQFVINSARKGLMQIWLGTDDAEVDGIMVTEVLHFPFNCRVRIVALASSDFRKYRKYQTILETWAIANGADSLEAWCQPAQAKLFKTRYGFERAYELIRKDLRRIN